MKDIWKKAKENQEVLHFKNFQNPEIGWEEVLSYVYNESLKYNVNVYNEAQDFKRARDNDEGPVELGNILAWNGYFNIRANNLFHFKGVRELLEKVNGGNSGEYCQYYSTVPGTYNPYKCNCNITWHTQALRFNITHHVVPDHNDPNDVLYWQLLGTSVWQINKDKKYTLEPGDLFYFSKEDSHSVFQDGPRSGIIIDGRKDGV